MSDTTFGKNSNLIALAVQSLRPVMNSWGKSCIDAKGNPNVEFLAEFEMAFNHWLLTYKPEVELIDHVFTDDTQSVNVKIDVSDRGIFLQPEGYGECEAQDGHGSPIGVEFYNGELRVLLWPDINQADAKIISMEQARETNRESE